MGAKQIHDEYGKQILKMAFGNDFNESPKHESFGKNAGKFKIDGIINDDIAVEIESRASKQVRGAIIDIIMHPCRKKLIILIKAYTDDATEEQCRFLLRKFAPKKRFKVITLKGTGNKKQWKKDTKRVKAAVKELQLKSIK